MRCRLRGRARIRRLVGEDTDQGHRFDDTLARVKAMAQVGASTDTWVVSETKELRIELDEAGASIPT